MVGVFWNVSGVKLFSECEIEINDFTVTEEVNLDDDGIITLTTWRNDIDPSDTGFPNNFYESMKQCFPLSLLHQIIEQPLSVLESKLRVIFSNINVTLGNGSNYYEKKIFVLYGLCSPHISRSHIP